MTLEELENTLPNGLHDAEVRRIAIDYQLRKVTLDVAVWVGDVNASAERRETYKNGQIDISGLLFVVMEPPDPKYPFQSSALKVDGCNMPKNLGSELLRALPADAFFRSLWVNQWNSFVHIAATNARIDWMDSAPISLPNEPRANC